MKSLLVGVALCTLMAGAAYGDANILILTKAGAASSIDFPPATGGTVQVRVNVTLANDPGNSLKTAQATMTADKPGVSYSAWSTTGGLIDQIYAGWDKDPTAQALFAGWFQPAPGDPTTPDFDINTGECIPIPGGPLPTPNFGSAATGAPKTTNNLAWVELTVGPGASYPIHIGLTQVVVGDSALNAQTPVVTNFTITPEPVSALLLAAGLMIVRRRR